MSFFGLGRDKKAESTPESPEETPVQTEAVPERDGTAVESSEDLLALAKSRLEDLLTFFGANTTVEASRDGETIELKVESDVSGQLIGHRGETLAALQHILNMMMRRSVDERIYVHIDVGGYRQARLERLEYKAEQEAAKVAESGEEAVLPPMTPAERRHVHSHLSDRDDVTTESRGEGNRRRLVIKKN